MGLVPTLAVGTNSYVTLAEAETYVSSERLPNMRPTSVNWDELTDAQKNRALIMAAQRFEEVKWAGKKVEVDQAMAWPRYVTANCGFYEKYESDEEIEAPADVKMAQVEEALAIAERESWLAQRSINRNEAKGVVIERNPDVILDSIVAWRILLETGWMCEYSFEMDQGLTL